MTPGSLLFPQTLTSASRPRARSAPPARTRLTATAACVRPGEPEPGVRKVSAHAGSPAGLLHNTTPLLFLIPVLTCLVWVPVNRHPCTDGGRIVADGARWDRDCNTCYCHNGRITCTKVGNHRTECSSAARVRAATDDRADTFSPGVTE